MGREKRLAVLRYEPRIEFAAWAHRAQTNKSAQPKKRPSFPSVRGLLIDALSNKAKTPNKAKKKSKIVVAKVEHVVQVRNALPISTRRDTRDA